MSDDLIPITDEQAKAIQEAAKFGVEGIKALTELGKFMKDVFGGVPKNLVGWLGGDYLEYRRLTNLVSLKAKFERKCEELGIREMLHPRLTLALPILEAAADESDSEMQDLWAALLAAAMDPRRSSKVRQAFITTVKKMDPMDAYVLRHTSKMSNGRLDAQGKSQIVTVRNVGIDEIDVSENNLIQLGCLMRPNSTLTAISPFGREFLRAVGE